MAGRALWYASREASTPTRAFPSWACQSMGFQRARGPAVKGATKRGEAVAASRLSEAA